MALFSHMQKSGFLMTRLKLLLASIVVIYFSQQGSLLNSCFAEQICDTLYEYLIVQFDIFDVTVK